MPTIQSITRPDAQFVQISIPAAPTRNFQVNLTKNWTKVFKMGTGQANIIGLNNIFLHFDPLTFDAANPAGSVAIVCGTTPNCWPLEQFQVAVKYVWKFCKGLPPVVYISTDFQADAPHTDQICFCGDEVEMLQNIRV